MCVGLVRPGASCVCQSLGASLCRLGMVWLARRPVSGGCTFPARGPLFSGLFSVKPVPLCGTLHSFPYSRVFYNGVSGPPRTQQSPIFSLPFVSRRRGSVLVQSRSVSSVCLSDRPFHSRNPASQCQLRVLSGLPAS